MRKASSTAGPLFLQESEEGAGKPQPSPGVGSTPAAGPGGGRDASPRKRKPRRRTASERWITSSDRRPAAGRRNEVMRRRARSPLALRGIPGSPKAKGHHSRQAGLFG